MAKAGSKYHHGNLRPALLDAARVHLAETGFEDLSLRALAREAGVSPTAPYRHFADREALLAALATEGYRELKSALEEAGGNEGDSPEAQLGAFARTYIDFAVNNIALFRLMFGASLQPFSEHPELGQASRETFDTVQQIVQRGIEQRRFRDENIVDLANSAWAGVHGLATLRIDAPELFERRVDLDRQIDLSLDIFLKGVAR